jgi:hypothetical protein
MNIQNQMKELFGNSCYAYCLAYIFGKDKDIKALTARVLDGWYFDYIQEDGFVKKPVDYVKMIDNSLKFRDVKKVPISSLSDIPDGMIGPVEYKYLSGSHFVVCQKGKVLFDPSEPSNSVRNGKPVSYRLFF